ncbi:hypothetical protein GA0116948_11030 [Chitinophaga costaii]|uniref:DNA-binding protein n=1 Tax=Chitinophaga costaii TaxID=1335309 RepID=A0A1C4EV51_9BACT|nr:hypothetical protein [Chitinophaga costaii]PUZ21626.1 hypothetical protein DCM91_16465 [Chitinophaga costaii]SCC47519.1 hypothetical protein GA0116948_11030 [Chitinophaga costaii]
MIKRDDLVIMRAVALCYKPFLKIEEALIYTNLGRTQFSIRCEEACVYKNEAGYFKREELDLMMQAKTVIPERKTRQ